MRRRLVFVPDRLLKTVAEPIKEVNGDIQQLAKDMLETMYVNNGIGLAANQVGILQRIFVMDVALREGKNDPIVMVNPKVIKASDEEATKEEGCLSIPGHFGDVTRPAEVTMQFVDVDGNEQTLDCQDWAAACAQHELDHLNGVLFTDHLSRLRRNMITKKMKKDKPFLDKQQEEILPNDHGLNEM
jgi:peptide deformylase